MSKSYGNSILLSDPEAEVRKKLKTMVTDPARVRRTDPGNPDVCPVGDLHKIFSTPETMAEVRLGCTTAGIGCIQCKGWVADNIVAILNPIQERRRQYENNPKLAWDILEAGSARARQRRQPNSGRGARCHAHVAGLPMGMKRMIAPHKAIQAGKGAGGRDNKGKDREAGRICEELGLARSRSTRLPVYRAGWMREDSFVPVAGLWKLLFGCTPQY